MKLKFPKIKISPKLKSRKFWFAIASALLPVLNQQLGWGLDEAVVVKAISGLWVFIAAEGAADVAGRLNGK